MPKVGLRIGALNFNINQVANITATGVVSISTNVLGQITSITTSSAVSGTVTDLNGTTNQITVSSPTGNVQLNLAAFGPGAGTYLNPINMSVDQFGRVQSITTSSVVASGTYTNLSSVTIDTIGRITAITTGSMYFPPLSTLTNSVFTGTTFIQQRVDSIYQFSGTPSGAIELNSTTATYYLTPGGDFTIQLVDPLYTNQGNIQNFTLIVNNTGGWSCTTAHNSTIPIRLTSGGTASNIKWIWVNGFQPRGTAGRVEVYDLTVYTMNITFIGVITCVYVSMASYG